MPKIDNDKETPKEYYYRLKNAKKNNEPWARDIVCDPIVHQANLVIQDPSDNYEYNKLIKLLDNAKTVDKE